ncbi:transcriptional regulator GcvA [Cupriavidus sp. 30B13]|uniref:transcriptional regulator GcvA n=1 Tax=Cupriavidus sp. 30B13 TaxID=3384241 RepID=UPI003B920965
MKTSLPPLNALLAFDAAARELNLAGAADLLCVTKGAVSLQVKRLEQSLGVALFARSPRGLALTPAGEAYFQAVSGALGLIGQATAAARTAAAPQLAVSCTPGFAAQWLVPRLGAFEARHPQVDIRIKASNQVADFARDGIAFAVRHGRGRYPGLHAHKLFDDDLTVVSAPALLRRRRAKPARREVAAQVLLHDEHRGDWGLWLADAGLPAALARKGPVFTDSNGVIEAVRAGNGVALVPRALVRQDLAARRLVEWFGATAPSGLAYYLVYPEATLHGAGAPAFRDWLLEQAGQAPAAGRQAATPGAVIPGGCSPSG